MAKDKETEVTVKKVKNPYLYKSGKEWKGNKDGRPKGTYSLVTILKRKLSEAVEKGGKELGEELVEIWLEQAKSKKDFKALEKIVQYIDGMPKQGFKLEGEINNNVELNDQQVKQLAESIARGAKDSLSEEAGE